MRRRDVAAPSYIAWSTAPTTVECPAFFGALADPVYLLYMGAAILPFGMLNHAFLSGRLGAAGLARGTAAAGAWLLLITLAAAWAPLALGRRSLARRDY